MPKEIDLKEIFLILKRRIWIIILMFILSTFTGYLYNTLYKAQPLYYSSTRLIINSDNSNIMSTLMVMIKDSAVMEKVSKELRYTRTASALSEEITASNVDSSQIISISVIDQDPRMAAQIANTTASVFKSEASKILNFKNINLLSEAKPNATPINPGNNNKLIFSAIIGLIIGVGLVFFIHSLDDTVRREKEIEEILKAPVLGSITKMKKKHMRARRITGQIKGGMTETKVSNQITRHGRNSNKPIIDDQDEAEITFENPGRVQNITR